MEQTNKCTHWNNWNWNEWNCLDCMMEAEEKWYFGENKDECPQCCWEYTIDVEWIWSVECPTCLWLWKIKQETPSDGSKIDIDSLIAELNLVNIIDDETIVARWKEIEEIFNRHLSK